MTELGSFVEQTSERGPCLLLIRHCTSTARGNTEVHRQSRIFWTSISKVVVTLDGHCNMLCANTSQCDVISVCRPEIWTDDSASHAHTVSTKGPPQCMARQRRNLTLPCAHSR